MKLIINADDFGYSRGINWGIIDSYNNGTLSSATIMANMPGFSHAVELAKQNPGLGVGVHLTLTQGRALTGVCKTITDGDGNFLKLGALSENISTIDLGEVEREYDAQISKVINSGIVPTHLDGHHHTHVRPGIINVLFKMAEKYRLPIRFPSDCKVPAGFENVRFPDVFSGDFYGEDAKEDFFIGILEKHKEMDGVLEIMCHPGYADCEVLAGSSYNVQRANEVEILTGDRVREFINENNIKIINYRDL